MGMGDSIADFHLHKWYRYEFDIPQSNETRWNKDECDKGFVTVCLHLGVFFFSLLFLKKQIRE